MCCMHDADRQPAGMNQAYQAPAAIALHAGIDIALLPKSQSKGLGPDSVRTLARYLIDERGHHRLTIDPAVANVNAIKAYERVGFKKVGVMRKYERGMDGTWHDGLLMDMLAEELPPEA